jgi:hypothetical protein
MIIARALTLALLAAAGCKPRCAPSLPASLEVRGTGGALEWALRQSPEKDARDLCDGAGAWQGVVRTVPEGVTLVDRAGQLKLRLVRDSAQVAVGQGPAGPRLRLYRDAQQARVLTPDGVPLAILDPTSDPERATVRAPSSLPIARVVRERDAVAVRMLDDHLRARVWPPGPPFAAGAFAVDALAPEERLLVYLYWSR